MQALIFTQKLLKQHWSLSSIIPLLALFVGLGTPQRVLGQATYISDNVTIDASPRGGTTTSTTYVGVGSGTPVFESANLGGGTRFNQSNGSLTLVAASATLDLGPFTTVTASTASYRVYASGASTLPNFSVLSLAPISGDNSPANSSSRNVVFGASNSTINLLNQPAVIGPGTYIVEIKYRSEFNANGTSGSVDEPTTAPGHRATFTVLTLVAPPGGTTEWIGGSAADPNYPSSTPANNWKNPDNWTNGVPNTRANAIIPSPPRPNPPILNVNNEDYSVNDLTLEVQDPANAFTTRGVLRVTTATLKIYGNIENGGNGILATTDAPGTIADPNSASAVIVMAGSNQTINQGRFANLVIQNNVVDQSTGLISVNPMPAVKSNLGVIEVPGSLTFAPNVKAVLRSTSVKNGALVLDTDGPRNVDLKNTGSVFGETNTGFLLGIMKVSRDVTPGVKQVFGNIGIDITLNNAGSTPIRGDITRVTGAVFSPVRPIPAGSTRPVSVKRAFGNSFSTIQAGYNADVVLHYNNSTTFADGQYDELNTNRDGFLSIFQTVSGTTFTRLGGVNTPDPTTYPGNGGTVEVKGLSNINTLTLADNERNPLPVELSAIAVQRVNTDALVTWTTASERNSKGFYVEVSTDGKNFRDLGFVASATANSYQAKDYRFVDAEAGKSGNRYYRLHQVDLDGKHGFSPVRVLNFGTTSIYSASTLTAYPNPFTSDLSIAVAGVSTGTAMLRLTDLAGSTVRSQQVALEGGSSTLNLTNLSELKSGVYLIQLILPSGKVLNSKVIKR